MKIPYGESNFKKVITGGYVYIDKTDYIAQLETAGSYHFLLRPRRFGKSLFVSMLWHYYDMAHQHEFEALFGKLHIGQYRLFVTGVTPLMLDSLTSGFNIAENLSIHAGFNAAMGFTHVETQGLLQPLADQCGLETDTLLADVTDWYNGYRFHADAKETVFNSDMVLYFAKHFDRDNCNYPKRMLDENIASDYRKIMALFQIGNREANYQVLDDLINVGDVLAVQQRKFELDKHFDRNDFISLLAYMGFVTISGETMTQTRFAIPNHVIRELAQAQRVVDVDR